MLSRQTAVATGVALAALFLAGQADAAATGAVYLVPESVASDVDLFAGGSPIITFTAPTPLSFASGASYTEGEFLASGGATILTGAGNLNTIMDDGVTGTVVQFTGLVTVTNGQTFTAGHDDGLNLVIGGTSVIHEPGGSRFAVTTDTYTGPSGNLPFVLTYGECCGSPGILQISLPFTPPVASVPEPASMLVLGGALAGMGMVRRRRKG